MFHNIDIIVRSTAHVISRNGEAWHMVKPYATLHYLINTVLQWVTLGFYLLAKAKSGEMN